MKVKVGQSEVSYDLAKALANKTRIRILTILREGEFTFDEVHSKLGSVKYKDTVYRHLEILRKVGLVEKRYDQDRKLLKYAIKTNEICFEF